MMDIIASKVLVHVIVGTLLMCTIDSRKLVTKRAPHLMRRKLSSIMCLVISPIWWIHSTGFSGGGGRHMVYLRVRCNF